MIPCPPYTLRCDSTVTDEQGVRESKEGVTMIQHRFTQRILACGMTISTAPARDCGLFVLPLLLYFSLTPCLYVGATLLA